MNRPRYTLRLAFPNGGIRTYTAEDRDVMYMRRREIKASREAPGGSRLTIYRSGEVYEKWHRRSGSLHWRKCTITPSDRKDEHSRYLGVLGLLGECSVFVSEDLREQIKEAFEDACADGQLKYRRILNRLEIEVAS